MVNEVTTEWLIMANGWFIVGNSHQQESGKNVTSIVVYWLAIVIYGAGK